MVIQAPRNPPDTATGSHGRTGDWDDDHSHILPALRRRGIGSVGPQPPADAGRRHRVVSILLATGVAYEVADEPGPITENEIAAFTAALEHEDWPERLGS